jgi:predicted ATPase
MAQPTQHVVVLTGGPGAGKTTLLRELARVGHAVVPEAAIDVIAELIAEQGAIEAVRSWRQSHPVDFQLRIANRQVALEALGRSLATPLLFCDRGLIDGVAYLERLGIEAPVVLQQQIELARYDTVFLLETLSTATARPETGRISSREESRILSERLAAAYQRYGHTVRWLPELPVAERLARVHAELGLVVVPGRSQ